MQITCGSKEIVDKIYIYDQIGDNGITGKQFIKKLDAIKGDEVEIIINSGGGEVFEGMAIYNAIKNYKGKTIASVSGIAYGISAIIALACDEVLMKKGTLLGISEAYIVQNDNKPETLENSTVKKCNEVMAGIYTNKSNKTKMKSLK